MKEDTLLTLERELKKSFDRWEYLKQFGGSDPFWPDGMNMNLVRNHILSYKKQIEDLVQSKEEELTLLPVTYPEIYYRATPDLVPDNYMARADEIRSRAYEQLSLYENDPNFIYIQDHFQEVFPVGETKETRAFDLSYYAIAHCLSYRKCVESDNLVDMRRTFYASYEEKASKFAEYATQLKAFLSKDHSVTPVKEDKFEDGPYPLFDEEEGLPEITKPSLDSIIQEATKKANKQERKEKEAEKQLSFF